jgi:ketosteroid isomerase-like protein
VPTIAELLAANLHEVFGNRDAAARRAAIERVYAEDVEFVDPEGEVRGWDALEAKAAGLLAGAPVTFAFAEVGPVYLGDGTGALAWRFGPAGEPVARGVDVVEVRDGRIHTLRTLLA